MRCTCVSTTTPSGAFQMTPRTTFAVLRPTPGSFTSSSIVRGTSPPCFSTSARARPTRLFVFWRKNPSVATSGSTSIGSAFASAFASG